MITIYGSSALVAGLVLALASFGWTIMAIATSGSGEENDSTLILGGMCTLSLSIVGLMFAGMDGDDYRGRDLR